MKKKCKRKNRSKLRKKLIVESAIEVLGRLGKFFSETDVQH